MIETSTIGIDTFAASIEHGIKRSLNHISWKRRELSYDCCPQLVKICRLLISRYIPNLLLNVPPNKEIKGCLQNVAYTIWPTFWLTFGSLLPYIWPTVGLLLAHCWPTCGPLLAYLGPFVIPSIRHRHSASGISALISSMLVGQIDTTENPIQGVGQ